jgi:tyrosine-protein kinase Etk/Wzc
VFFARIAVEGDAVAERRLKERDGKGAAGGAMRSQGGRVVDAVGAMALKVPADESAWEAVRMVVGIVARRRRLAGWTAGAVAAAAMLTALLWPTRYTATAVILPPQQSGSTGAAMLAQLSNLGAAAGMAGALGMKNPNDLQVALLKSRSVEDAMAARFHLQALYRGRDLTSTRRQWERVTKVENGLKDGLLRLSVSDGDARRASELANGWVEEYRRFAATLALTEAAQRRVFLEGQLHAAHGDLADAEEEFKRTQQRTGVIQMDGQMRAMIDSAAVLRARLAAKQVEMGAMREFAAEGNPDLERAGEEVAGLKGQLAAMGAGGESGDLVVPKGPAAEAGLEYARASREVKYRETIYELLARQYEAARLDEARQGAEAQVVDAAVTPDRPSSPPWWAVVLAGGAAAMPFGVFAAVTAEAVAVVRRRELSGLGAQAAFEGVGAVR